MTASLHDWPIVHTLYVPAGWTPDQVLAELQIYGRLLDDPGDGGEWLVIECPGGDACLCWPEQFASDARVRINGVVVRDLCDEHPRPWWCKLRRRVAAIRGDR